jgi:hypothetical protein
MEVGQVFARVVRDDVDRIGNGHTNGLDNSAEEDVGRNDK